MQWILVCGGGGMLQMGLEEVISGASDSIMRAVRCPFLGEF
jgi:hypothetical protein